MTESEWLACEDPDLLLESLEGKVDRECLVDFVRRCWRRIEGHLPPVPSDYTVADQFAALVPGMSDHDAVLYASEGALKAARWCPDVEAERKLQAELLRRLAPRPR